MNDVKYRIGIIDDDNTKVTQLITFLKLGFMDENGTAHNPKYDKFSFEPIEIILKNDVNDMVDDIISQYLDAIIIDYKLASQENISYTGVYLAKEVSNKLYDFPIFILTSHQDDLFTHELFNAYQVFNFSRYIADDEERLELNIKIIEQINKYRVERQEWESSLKNLIPQAGTSAQIDQKILELDSKLERTLNNNSSIPDKLKKELTSDRVQKLIDKIDKLIDNE